MNKNPLSRSRFPLLAALLVVLAVAALSLGPYAKTAKMRARLQQAD